MADGLKVDTKEFIAFYKAISQTDKELKKSFRKRLMLLAKPIVAEVKAAELAIPSKGASGPTRKKKGETLGLRASLAAATKADFNATGRGSVLHVRVSKTRFAAVSGRYVSLPYYMDGRRKRAWRHPVFGDKNVWIKQDAHPFLGKTVDKYKPEFARQIGKAVEDTLDYIDHKVK